MVAGEARGYIVDVAHGSINRRSTNHNRLLVLKPSCLRIILGIDSTATSPLVFYRLKFIHNVSGTVDWAAPLYCSAVPFQNTNWSYALDVRHKTPLCWTISNTPGGHHSRELL
jgi:hypothetical protein